MINLDGPPLCDECGRRLAPHTDGMECGYCGWGTRLVVRSARDQAPHHSAEIERLRAEVERLRARVSEPVSSSPKSSPAE